MAGDNPIRALRALLITEAADGETESSVEAAHVGIRRVEVEEAGISRRNR